MPDARALVFIVDDEPIQAETLSRLLDADDLRAEVLASPRALLERLRSGQGDAVVSDLRMPEMDGLALFQAVQRERPGLPFFIMTGFGTIETAIEAMRAGVSDFVTKPIDADHLGLRIRSELEIRRLRSTVQSLERAVTNLRGRLKLIGRSRAFEGILERIAQVAKSQATVLISGESGTGKELVARAIHLESPRHLGPYVSVNCAAIPESLLEAELFGHKKGAFTGADRDRPGRFAQADGGTLFLDEIGDLPLALQPKLLRALQERTIEPLGGRGPERVDVRVLAATHQDLRGMVQAGTFREDLYYRLAVIPIEVPPLRERRDDIPELARHFLHRYREENGRPTIDFSADALQSLAAHDWPGNVRELENCIERAVVLARSDRIEPLDLGLAAQTGLGEDAIDAVLDQLLSAGMGFEEFERGLILRAVDRAGGNLSRAARSLGLTRRAIQYRMEKFRKEGEPDLSPTEGP